MESSTIAPGPLTAHLTSGSHAGTHSGAPAAQSKGLHLGRERVKWSQHVWDRIDHAVQHEFRRTCVAAMVLPHHQVDSHITTVQQDQILSYVNGPAFNQAQVLIQAMAANTSNGAPTTTISLLPNIDESATTRLFEIWVEYSLTPQQVEHENTFKHDQETHSDPHGHPDHAEHAHHDHHDQHAQHAQHSSKEHSPHTHRHHHSHKHIRYSTAVTLATRAANILSQALDAAIFQGQVSTGNMPAPPNNLPKPAGYIAAGPFFSSGLVTNRGFPIDFGLLGLAPAGQTSVILPSQVVQVLQTATDTPNFSTQTITIAGAPWAPPGATPSFNLSNGTISASIPWSPETSSGTASTPHTPLVQNVSNAVLNTLAVAPYLGLNLSNASISSWSLINGVGTIQLSFPAIPTVVLSADPTNLGPPYSAYVTVGAGDARYVENTVRGIAQAYSKLQAAGHYGPYAAVVHYTAYADAYGPLSNTLILPADRINPLMTEGFLGTGSLPGVPAPVYPSPANGALGWANPASPSTQAMGVVISTGANTMDLVIGQHPITAFSQTDQYGNHLFRVLARFALRLKDPSAVIRLEFQ
jgi:Encapsulating protein for peroxidase